MRTGPARAGAAAVLASAAFLAPPAGAATFTVSTTADSGAGSLRQAVLDANASGTDDTIAFSGALAGQTITLAGGPLVVAKPGTSLLVDGATLSPRVQVSGGGTSGLLDVTAGTVTVRQLQLRDGRGPDGVAGAPGAGNASGGGGGGGGGAVVNQQGATLVLDSSLITGNTGGNGGAGGDSGLAGGGGGGGGGAIVNAGTMWVIGSTLESNRGGDGGVPGASTSGGFGTGGGGAGAGAITNTGGGTLTIQNSTLVANVGGTGARGPVPLSAASGAGAGGGGAGGAAIANNAGGVLNVLNSTLFRNTGGPGGAGGTNVDGQKINGMSGGGGGGPLGGGGGGGGQLGVSAPGGPGGVAGNSGGSGGFDSIAAQPGVGAGGGGGGGAASAGGAGGPEGGGGGGGDSAAGGGGAGGGGAGGGSSSASASASGGGGGFGGGGAGGDNEAGSAPGTSASGFGGSGGVGRTSPGGLVITPATAGTFGGGGGGAGDRTGAAAAPGSVGSAALVAAGGGATVNSSIFAGSLTPLATPTNECRGTVTGSANLLQDPAACTRAAGDTRSGDPLLDPAGLKDNGGPTPTIGLQAGSQAIDTGANPAALPFDQRGPGFARTVHGTPDIGALELPSVRVVKDLSPLSDPGRFDLSIGSNVVAAEVGDDGAGEVVVPVRTDVTVAETAVGAATSRPYDSSIDCGSGSQAGTSRQLLNVVSSVTCTFTNRYRPTITVTKRVVPAGDRGRFDLHVDGTPVETGVGDGGRGSRIVAGGSSVTVSETGAAGTSLSDYATTIDCGGGSQAGSSLTLTNVAGDTACTITNARRPFTGGCANPRIGTAAGERIDGSALGDLIYGLGGNDTLFGAAGTDCLFGADGDDTLWGNDGKDWLWAGAGDDSLYGRAGGDKLRGEANADRLSGGKGNDGLKGGPGNDRLAGHTGRDFLSGGHGADSLNGGKGIDTYFGRRGVDRVRAADGRRERVNCGPGDDTAIVDARDATTGCEKRTVRR